MRTPRGAGRAWRGDTPQQRTPEAAALTLWHFSPPNRRCLPHLPHVMIGCRARLGTSVARQEHLCRTQFLSAGSGRLERAEP